MNLQHTKTEAIQGVLWSSHGPWLTLRDPVVHEQLKDSDLMVRRPTEGEVIVHRSNVAYIQVLP